MKRPVFLLAVALAAVSPVIPAAVQAQQVEPRLSLEQRMLLRCSAAFAILANRQQAGDAAALTWPDIRQRGGEYFVRASAQLMDEAGLDRTSLAQALGREAQDIAGDGETLGQMMPHCLLSLEASGL